LAKVPAEQLLGEKLLIDSRNKRRRKHYGRLLPYHAYKTAFLIIQLSTMQMDSLLIDSTFVKLKTGFTEAGWKMLVAGKLP
jgi:hypothetical protein